jgi:hypothetical protein
MTTLPFMPPCNVPMGTLARARRGTIHPILYICLREGISRRASSMPSGILGNG